MSKVVLNKVEKQYPNGFKAVHGIDLEIKDGEFMVFVGPSGCAKSTTLRMIAGLEEITGGEETQNQTGSDDCLMPEPVTKSSANQSANRTANQEKGQQRA